MFFCLTYINILYKRNYQTVCKLKLAPQAKKFLRELRKTSSEILSRKNSEPLPLLVRRNQVTTLSKIFWCQFFPETTHSLLFSETSERRILKLKSAPQAKQNLGKVGKTSTELLSQKYLRPLASLEKQNQVTLSPKILASQFFRRQLTPKFFRNF